MRKKNDRLQLTLFESNKNTVPLEQLKLLEQIFRSGTWDPLIAHTEQLLSQGPPPQQSSAEHIYEFAFEYAIERKEERFLRNMILHEKIMCSINHGLFFHYVKGLHDPDFEIQALTAMVNNFSPHHRQSYSVFSLSSEFEKAAHIIFSRLQLLDKEQDSSNADLMINAILKNQKINAEKKYSYLHIWQTQFFTQLNNAPNEHIPEMINQFLHYLPADNQILVNALAGILSANTSNSLAIEMMIERFLTKFPLDSDQLITVLNKIHSWSHIQASYIEKLIAHVNPAHSQYQGYQLTAECIALDPAKRPEFILQHPEILTNAKGEGHRWLIHSLNTEGRKTLIERYIKEPDLLIGSFLISRYMKEFDTDLMSRYLTASHVELPVNCLLKLVENYPDCSSLIALLMQRSDFVLTPPDLFKSLSSLFQEAHEEAAVSCLLIYPPALEVLKQYEALHGDDQLPSLLRGTLMPSVLAWYIAESNNYPEAYKELYASIPENMRKELLGRCISRVIHSDQPTLRSYITQSGKGDLIGTAYPRLISLDTSPAKQHTFFVPKAWDKPRVIEVLEKIQRETTQRFAKNRSKEFNFLPDSSETIGTLALKAAAKCGINTLIFEHRTAEDKIKTILGTGKLKSRLHLQGHRLSGKASAGLTNPVLPLDHPKAVFSFFTRASQDECNSGVLPHFSELIKGSISRVELNGGQLFADNPQIKFLVIGIYPYFTEKKLQLPGGYILSSTLNVSEGEVLKNIEFNSGRENLLLTIHQKMFELIFEYYINPLPEPIKTETTEKLINPQSEEDLQFIRDFLDFMPLEWLIPGDTKLKISYVNKIYTDEKRYDLSDLHQIGLHASETEVLAVIKTFEEVLQYPFVWQGMLDIARRRKQDSVISYLLQREPKTQVESTIVYSPDEVYQIESLVQLLLEEHDNDSVYAQFLGDSVLIQTTLQQNTNHGGVHHAEMSKLHYALGIGNLEGRNALEIRLEDNLTVKFGEDAPFASLVKIRDALLTYELTTLIASQQNSAYYKAHHGQFHPETGKGATNGKIALKKNRLFFKDIPYEITVSCNDEKKQIYVDTSNTESVLQIASAMQNVLGFSDTEIAIDKNGITLNIAAKDLIARLRQQATFYEGINVITETGQLLLAVRKDKGLASAGGHHSDKYSSKGIGYGLYSEFGLEFKEPTQIEQSVVRLKNIKTISKTGIYVVRAEALVPTKKALQHADNHPMPVVFMADPEEFVAGSEVALTLTEMRGQPFYDVMPIAELCQYQLEVFKHYLEEHFSTDYEEMTFAIDDHIDRVAGPTATNKIPSPTFGRIHITINGEIRDELRQLFEEKNISLKQISSSQVMFDFDESPFALLNAIEQRALEASPSPSSSM